MAVLPPPKYLRTKLPAEFLQDKFSSSFGLYVFRFSETFIFYLYFGPEILVSDIKSCGCYYFLHGLCIVLSFLFIFLNFLRAIYSDYVVETPPDEYFGWLPRRNDWSFFPFLLFLIAIIWRSCALRHKIRFVGE